MANQNEVTNVVGYFVFVNTMMQPQHLMWS